MNRIHLGLVLLSCLTLSGSVRAAEDPHIILITLDGFPSRMFWDPKTPIPRIRQLAKEGVAAEGMRVSNPTVTWPNHTTLVTGVRAAKHSVLYNGIAVRGGPDVPVKIDPKRDQKDLVAVPTIFDRLHQSGLRTAAINWPCTRGSDTLDDNFPDAPDQLTHTTPRLRRELVSEHIIADETDASFGALTAPGRDQVWTRAASHVLRMRRPQLLLLHLLNTDGTHHRYGPESPASYTAMALADFYVGQLLDALELSGLRTNTTVFLVADHGFATALTVLQPNILLREAGLLEIGGGNQIAKARAQVIPEGGMGMIYLNDPPTRDADRCTVIELFRGKDGVAEIIEPAQFAALGLPMPEQHPGMADLILVPREGCAVSGAAGGEDFAVPVAAAMNRGYHGYHASDPRMNALFIAGGRGVKRGVKVGLVDNLDVAPTIARLLGQPLPGADGKPMTEILTGPE